MNTCPAAVEMFRDPEQRPFVLDPEDEFRRWHAWLKSPEGEAFTQAEKDEQGLAYRAQFTEKIARERERFNGHSVDEPVKLHR